MTELTPTRGRGSCGDWRRDYEARRMTAAKAAELVRDGDTVVFHRRGQLALCRG